MQNMKKIEKRKKIRVRVEYNRGVDGSSSI
jgi:hypothetical protein